MTTTVLVNGGDLRGPSGPLAAALGRIAERARLVILAADGPAQERIARFLAGIGPALYEVSDTPTLEDRIAAVRAAVELGPVVWLDSHGGALRHDCGRRGRVEVIAPKELVGVRAPHLATTEACVRNWGALVDSKGSSSPVST